MTSVARERGSLDDLRDLDARGLAECLPHMVWVQRPDGSTEHLNTRGWAFVGQAAAATDNWSWFDAVHVDDIAAARQGWARAVGDGTAYEGEFRMRDAEGNVRWIASSGALAFPSDGSPAHWAGTWVDIDDRGRSGDADHPVVTSPVDSDARDAPRLLVSDHRDRLAEGRDGTSEASGVAADARDRMADARDVRADDRDRVDGTIDLAAAADRADARRDRVHATRDRAGAAADRQASSSDRVDAAGDRSSSSVDGLTGAYRREFGFAALEREMARANRSGDGFVVAFVDIDGLKATNDSLGHRAGDQLICDVAGAIRARLRPYDVLVRFGGDEFVCGLTGVDMADVATRMRSVSTDLDRTSHASVTFGLAEVTAADSLATLVARADQAMYATRTARATTPG